MRIEISGLVPSALCAVVCTAFMAGCGGSQPPIAAQGAMQVNSTLAQRGENHAWMAPGAKGRDLLYVSLGTVNVYSYPRGDQLGSLGVSGDFLCSDKFGNIFIPTNNGEVLVYAHGETRPKTIVYYNYETNGCAVDPNSEALAVAGNFTGGLVVFPYNPRRLWRYGQIYRDSNMFEYAFCAYDDKGNLFIDGQGLTQSFLLIELPKGSRTFTTINLDQSISVAGSMQWNHGYLSIQDAGLHPAVIYRFAISGSSGTKVSTTHLHQSGAGAQFWIQGKKIIGPLSYGTVWSVGFWKFPAGGSPIKDLSTNNTQPVGETVSLK